MDLFQEGIMPSEGEEEPPGRLRRGTAAITVFRIFGDESYTSSGEYRVQGALWVQRDLRLRAELARINARPGEIKWSEIRGKRLRRRARGLVDVFFTSPVAACMHFNAIIVPHKDDPALRVGECELGVNKTWHTLLKNRLWSNSENYIDLDERPGRTDKDEAKLKGFLNRSGSQSRCTVKLCRSVQSHSEDLIQLTDLLVGAIGWEWNGRPSASPAKAEMHRHICERLKCTTLRRETNRHPKFDLWLYRPTSQRAVSA
jgi:hypothetical protein